MIMYRIDRRRGIRGPACRPLLITAHRADCHARYIEPVALSCHRYHIKRNLRRHDGQAVDIPHGTASFSAGNDQFQSCRILSKYDCFLMTKMTNDHINVRTIYYSNTCAWQWIGNFTRCDQLVRAIQIWQIKVRIIGAVNLATRFID